MNRAGVLVGLLVLASLTSCHLLSVELTGDWELTRATGPHTSAAFADHVGAHFDRDLAQSGCEALELSTRVDGDNVSITVNRVGYRRGGCDGDFSGDADDLLHGRYADLLTAIQHGDRDGDRLVLWGHGVRLVFHRLGDVD